MPEEFPHKILIVDDEKSVGKSLGRILMAEDIDFIYVESGVVALEEIKSAKEPFSIIISDQRMPGMQGTEFLEKAREIHPDTIRFLLTAYSDMDIIINSVNKGAIHKFINKPWDNDELLQLAKTYFKQYEEIFEGAQLLKIVKKQNKKLYDLDCEFMENITSYDKTLENLDLQIDALEQQITDAPSTSLSKKHSDKIIQQMQEVLIKKDKPDPVIIDKFYKCCIKNLYDEFEDIANRNGFEMPQTIAGAANE
jgi:response regulator RpfG family c-di-GMP phosphodiesterase